MAKATCWVDGCKRPVNAKGLCGMHYRRQERYGDPLQVPLSREERFWARVDKDGPVPPHRPELGPCWVWTGARNTYGYGSVYIDTKRLRTHRVAWEMANGPVPDGLHVLHHCDNPPCVNAQNGHLWLGTHLENVADMYAKGRNDGFWCANKRKTHCLRGHPLSGDNLYERDGQRRCKICQRAAWRRWQARRQNL